MNTLSSLLEDSLKKDLKCLEKNSGDAVLLLSQSTKSYFEQLHQAIARFRKNGSKFTPAIKFRNFKELNRSINNETTNRNSFKENRQPNEANEHEEVKEEGRPKRTAKSKATLMINQQSNLNLNTKLRQPSGEGLEPFLNAYVKLEKKSLNVSDKASASDATFTTESAKTVVENIVKEEMPAPLKPPPRKKRTTAKATKKSSQLKIKQEMIAEVVEDLKRDSDVVIQERPIPTVVVSDDEQVVVETRSTRTKTIRKKRALDESGEEKRTKKSKSNSSGSEYSDAQSTLGEVVDNKGLEINNATFVSEKAPELKSTMNSTVIVEKPLFNHLNHVAEELMTDDEEELPAKKVHLKQKPVFSPFDPSPVKKKVAAFEKLGAQAQEVRVTRTKTRALAKGLQETKIQEIDEIRTTVKEKAKFFTPSVHSRLPLKAGATTSKVHRILPNSSTDSSNSSTNKVMSALKASQAEYREREIRKDRELDALRKKEALFLAQTEEKKRKREEKQEKARQHREAMEKEKLKAVEAQKLKEVRHKQMMAEQEEKKLRAKEEAERKRMLAKKKALQEKKKEEERLLEQKRKEEEINAQMARREDQVREMVKKKNVGRKEPIYMKTPAPLLPTNDCYDSDDDQCQKAERPAWIRGTDGKETLFVMSAAGERIKNTFFSIKADTPDLAQIFEVIDPRYLKRNSSAIWHKPSKYSVLPSLPRHEEYSEDDD